MAPQEGWEDVALDFTCYAEVPPFPDILRLCCHHPWSPRGEELPGLLDQVIVLRVDVIQEGRHRGLGVPSRRFRLFLSIPYTEGHFGWGFPLSLAEQESIFPEFYRKGVPMRNRASVRVEKPSEMRANARNAFSAPGDAPTWWLEWIQGGWPVLGFRYLAELPV